MMKMVALRCHSTLYLTALLGTQQIKYGSDPPLRFPPFTPGKLKWLGRASRCVGDADTNTLKYDLPLPAATATAAALPHPHQTSLILVLCYYYCTRRIAGAALVVAIGVVLAWFANKSMTQG